MEGTCSQCESEFESLGLHWSLSSDCSYPELSQKRKLVSSGLVLGDGNLSESGLLTVVNTNERYLEELDEIFGRWSRGVTFRNSGEDQAEMSYKYGFDDKAHSRNYSDVYYLNVSTNSYFKSMREKWYKGGEKSVPKDMEFSEELIKHWYVCDGTIRHRDNDSRNESVEISSKFDVELLSNKLKQKGFNPYTTDEWHRIEFGVEGTEKFFDYIGDPVPGFEYKWPEDRV